MWIPTRLLTFASCALFFAGCGGSGSSIPAPPGQSSALGVTGGTAGTLRAAPDAAVRAQDTVASSVPPTYRFLYGFKGGPGDGGQPAAGLTELDGVLYGTTFQGGADQEGTVFEVTSSGRERVLHTFTDTPDGWRPLAGLVALNGTLYGTTELGGAHGMGTVFALSPAGTERVLYSFKGGTDGANPTAGLIALNGTLYGTTSSGGANCGTVFALSTSGSERVLHAFHLSTDGDDPRDGLIAVNGELYGTTYIGGKYGFGDVFKVSTFGALTVLHNFYNNGTDGVSPAGGLTELNGALYGTTYEGGTGDHGTVFSVSTSGAERVIYSFKSGLDGASPVAGLLDVNGALYGTTSTGGSLNVGVVFEVSPSGSERVLHTFTNNSTEGAFPEAGLIEVNGALYGTTFEGGANGSGTVFEIGL